MGINVDCSYFFTDDNGVSEYSLFDEIKENRLIDSGEIKLSRSVTVLEHIEAYDTIDYETFLLLSGLILTKEIFERYAKEDGMGLTEAMEFFEDLENGGSGGLDGLDSMEHDDRDGGVGRGGGGGRQGQAELKRESSRGRRREKRKPKKRPDKNGGHHTRDR